MNCKFGCLFMILFMISSFGSINAFGPTFSDNLEIQNIYVKDNINANDVPTFDLDVYEHANEHKMGNRDHSLKYVIKATEIMNENIKPQILAQGSGEVSYTLKVPTTVTKLEFYYSGADNVYIWAGPIPAGWTPDAYWTDEKCELHQNNYPNYSHHSVKFSSIQHGWPNYNDPSCTVDGSTNAFSNKDGSYGYGAVGKLYGAGYNKLW